MHKILPPTEHVPARARTNRQVKGHVRSARSAGRQIDRVHQLGSIDSPQLAGPPWERRDPANAGVQQARIHKGQWQRQSTVFIPATAHAREVSRSGLQETHTGVSHTRNQGPCRHHVRYNLETRPHYQIRSVAMLSTPVSQERAAPPPDTDGEK